MRLTLGLLLWLAATAPAAQSETIVVEAEEFSKLAGWRPVSSFYLGGIPCSGGNMIRCGGGEAFTTIRIPAAGTWHVWVRSHGAPSRGVRVRVGQTLLPAEIGKAKVNWTLAGHTELPAGPVTLALIDAKGGPYMDAVVRPAGDQGPSVRRCHWRRGSNASHRPGDLSP